MKSTMNEEKETAGNTQSPKQEEDQLEQLRKKMRLGEDKDLPMLPTETADQSDDKWHVRLQHFERDMYEKRQAHPYLFNFATANFLLSAFLIGAKIREKTRIVAFSMIFSIGATAVVYAAYMRTLNPRWRNEYALPSRFDHPENKYRAKVQELDKVIDRTHLKNKKE